MGGTMSESASTSADKSDSPPTLFLPSLPLNEVRRHAQHRLADKSAASSCNPPASASVQTQLPSRPTST